MALNTDYQEFNFPLNVANPSHETVGRIVNHNNISLKTMKVRLNPTSTQDFFASGEFLKVVDKTGSILVVDVVDAIDDDVIGILHYTSGAITKQKKDTGSVVQVFSKGDTINLLSTDNNLISIMLETKEALEITDKLEPQATGFGVQKITTGTIIGKSESLSMQAGIIQVNFTK